MVASVPCTPETPVARAELDALRLPGMIMKFTNWARRLVPQRPRTFEFAPGFWDGLTRRQERTVYDLAHRIRRGDNLTPLLSERAPREGFKPADAGRRKTLWDAKDFALNAWGVHHLHLWDAPRRADELLFVMFSRDHGVAIMLGDHKSFDDGRLENRVAEFRAATGYMTLKKGVTALVTELPSTDRSKLARRAINSIASADGKVVIGSMLSGDGSSTWNFMHMKHVIQALQNWEPNLGVSGWLASVTNPPMAVDGSCYRFVGTDLCLVSSDGNMAAILLPGFL